MAIAPAVVMSNQWSRVGLGKVASAVTISWVLAFVLWGYAPSQIGWFSHMDEARSRTELWARVALTVGSTFYLSAMACIFGTVLWGALTFRADGRGMVAILTVPVVTSIANWAFTKWAPSNWVRFQ